MATDVCPLLIFYQHIRYIILNAYRGYFPEKRGAYRILVGRPEGRGPLVRPRRRWKDNIKMDLQDVGWRHGLD
jgi:hypothetical protein